MPILKRASGAMQPQTISHRMWGRRVLALVLCAVLCAGMFFSTLFIEQERDHHCPGKECGICVQLAACSAFLRGLGLGVLLLCAMAATLRRTGTVLGVIAVGMKKSTLVSLKIKLTN